MFRRIKSRGHHIRQGGALTHSIAMQQSSGPAQELGSAALALTNHDKESFNFGVMAEASVLPPTHYGAEGLQIKNCNSQNHCRPRTWSLIAAQGVKRSIWYFGMMCGSVTCC